MPEGKVVSMNMSIPFSQSLCKFTENFNEECIVPIVSHAVLSFNTMQ